MFTTWAILHILACLKRLERGVCGLFGASGTWGLWPVRSVWDVSLIECYSQHNADSLQRTD